MTLSDGDQGRLYTVMFEKEFNNMSYGVAGYAWDYSKVFETWKRARNITRIFTRELCKRGQDLKIADVGCSSGFYVFLLNSLVCGARKALFRGIDYLPEEIDMARRLQERFGLDNVVFEVGDAAKLALPEASFDIVLCAEVIEHIARPEDCLKGIHRILKPGGLAIVTTPNRDNGMMSLKRACFHGPLRPASGARAGQEAPGDPHVSVKGLKEWISIMKACGFSVEKVKRGWLFRGGRKFNNHPVLFALSMFLDFAFDHLPGTANLTENITFALRKSGA